MEAPLYPQSGMLKTTNVANSTKYGTVSFHDQSPAFDVSVAGEMDPTRDCSYVPDLDFQHFFKRPVLIHEENWAVNGGLNSLISPWELWMQNPRISNRLNNYRNFSGDLRIKVVMQGNGFYWGSAFLSYYPYTEEDEFYNTDASYLGDLISASQRPHIYLDPTLSEGGEMTLPFFWPRDKFNLVSSLPGNLGQLWLYTTTVLRHASNTDAISIKIYAWCENVKLSSPTQSNIGGLLPQAGEYPDEHALGPISKPAAIISKMAQALSSVPSIRPYALASQMGADAVGKIAQMFGMCKPRQVEDTKLYRLNQAGDLACIDSLDPSNTLAFNAKRELTIDPSLTGWSPVDEMSLSVMAARESYLVTTAWEMSDSTNSVLFSHRVQPVAADVSARVLPASQPGINYTPAAFAAIPFDFWRGTVRFRFQVIASAYHRGRLLVVWDPVSGDSNPETQVVTSEIIDISEERDFSIDIKWGNEFPALQVPSPPTVDTYRLNAVWADSPFSNGVLTVYVLNELTSSSTSTDAVAINVYHSCPELELFAPNSDNINMYTPVFQPQSGLVPQAGAVVSDEVGKGDVNEPDSDGVLDDMGGRTAPKSSMFMHGDPVDNIRTLVKRFALREVMWFDSSGTSPAIRYYTQNASIFSRFRDSATFLPTTARAFFGSAFAGWRGGVRFKVYPRSEGTTTNFSIVRNPSADSSDTFAATYAKTPVQLSKFYSFEDESFSGMALTTKAQSDVLEIEVPCYTHRRFLSTYYSEATSTIAGGISVRAIDLFNDINSVIEVYEAVADDFNMFCFRGVPTFYLLATPPT